MLTADTNQLTLFETTHTWEELTEAERTVAVIIHSHQLRGDVSELRRLFNLGHPKIVFGPGHSYCRIHADSVEVMKVIINNYL